MSRVIDTEGDDLEVGGEGWETGRVESTALLDVLV